MVKFPIRAVIGHCFSHESEDLEKVKEAFEIFFPKKKITEKNATGVYGTQIIVLSCVLENKPGRELAKQIIDNFSKLEKDQILKEIRRRTDEEGKLYLRFDKQIAYEKKKRVLTSETEDSIQIILQLESFPAKYEGYIATAEKLLKP